MAEERLATALRLRTSQPAGARSKVICPRSYERRKLGAGPVRRTPELGAGRLIEMPFRLRSKGMELKAFI